MPDAGQSNGFDMTEVRALKARVDGLPCLQLPAESCQLGLPPPVEVGYLDEAGRQVFSAPADVVAGSPSDEPPSGPPLQIEPQIDGSYRGEQNPMATTPAGRGGRGPQALQQNLDAAYEQYQQTHPPWYEAPFFQKTALGGIVLLAIVFVLPMVADWTGWGKPQPQQKPPEAVSAPVPTVVPPTPVTSPSGSERMAENEILATRLAARDRTWLEIVRQFSMRIENARRLVDEVDRAASRGRLYPAEHEKLREALRLIEQTNGLVTVPHAVLVETPPTPPPTEKRK